MPNSTSVISTGIMAVLVAFHMTLKYDRWTMTSNSEEVWSKSMTPAKYLHTGHISGHSEGRRTFQSQTLTPNFSNQNFPTSSEICWVVKRRRYLSKNSPEIETSSFLHNILLCILVTVKLGLKSLGLALVVEMLSMAFPVVEFSRQGYKIRKVFG